MYTPSHQELVDMGFEVQEWEGKIYGYDFQSLSYCVLPVAPYRENDTDKDKTYPYWTLGSWYNPWHPETRENIENVIKYFETKEPQVEIREERTQFDPKVEGLPIDKYRNDRDVKNHHMVGEIDMPF